MHSATARPVSGVVATSVTGRWIRRRRGFHKVSAQRAMDGPHPDVPGIFLHGSPVRVLGTREARGGIRVVTFGGSGRTPGTRPCCKGGFLTTGAMRTG